jgi:carboxypeptidase D
MQASVFLREFVLGNNRTGLVTLSGVVGGESVTMQGPFNVLPGETNAIFFGAGTTQGSTVWPSATISAWNKFIMTAGAVAATPT